MEIFLQDSAEVMFLIEEQHFLVIVERHEEEQERRKKTTKYVPAFADQKQVQRVLDRSKGLKESQSSKRCKGHKGFHAAASWKQKAIVEE